MKCLIKLSHWPCDVILVRFYTCPQICDHFEPHFRDLSGLVFSVLRWWLAYSVLAAAARLHRVSIAHGTGPPGRLSDRSLHKPLCDSAEDQTATAPADLSICCKALSCCAHSPVDCRTFSDRCCRETPNWTHPETALWRLWRTRQGRRCHHTVPKENARRCSVVNPKVFSSQPYQRNA